MKNILILTSDPFVLNASKELLSDQNFNVINTIEPDNIFCAIEQHKPDLLMVEFILEDTNGGAICHQVKCNPKTHRLPVILLTDDHEVAKFSKKFGCNAVVARPFDIIYLATKINKCLKEANRVAV